MNNASARLVYNNAVTATYRAFRNDMHFPLLEKEGRSAVGKYFKLTQSFLRLEQPLAVGTGNYNFPVMVNQASPQIFNSEQRLNLQDSFVLSSLAMFVAKPASGTDLNFKLATYFNSVTFPAFATEIGLYNGTLNLAVNNNILIPAWDLWQHWFSPITQLTGAANSPVDEFRGEEDSFVAVEPNIAILGNKNTQINILLKTGLTAIDANSRVVLFLRGILVQNSTPIS
jgi:hypothetical protein